MPRKKKRRSRRSRQTIRNRWLVGIGIGALAAVTIVISAFALAPRSAPIAGPVSTPSPIQVDTRKAPPKVAIIGDSWTCGGGLGTGQDTSFAARAMRQLGWYYKLACQGGTGYTRDPADGSNFGGTRLQGVIDYQPDIVIVQGSTNDYEATADELAAASSDLYARIHEAVPNAKLYVMGPLYTPASPNNLIDVARGVLADTSASNQAIWIDPAAEGWLDVPGDFADEFHPNNAGHQKLADRLQGFLDADNPDEVSRND